jgi:YVTN family beta-propeller protein
MACSPDGVYLYVVCPGDDQLSVIDTKSNGITATVTFDNTCFAVAVSPDGTHVYVTVDNDSLAVIDAATHTIVTIIAVGNGPIAVTASPDGARVYVLNYGVHTVSVVDTATNTVTATIPVGKFPVDIAINGDGTRLYVADQEYDFVWVIDTAFNTVAATVGVGQIPLGVAVSPAEPVAYVVNSYDATVSVIDTVANTVTATFPFGKKPAIGKLSGGVAFRPDGTAYVANGGDGTLVVISEAVAPADHWHPPHLSAALLGAVARDGGGWLVIGDHFIPIPPRSPLIAIIAQAAAPQFDGAIRNPVLSARIRSEL